MLLLLLLLLLMMMSISTPWWQSLQYCCYGTLMNHVLLLQGCLTLQNGQRGGVTKVTLLSKKNMAGCCGCQ